jgi:hypothetical protein
VAEFADVRWIISGAVRVMQATFFPKYLGPITPFEMTAITLIFIIPIILAAVYPTPGAGISHRLWL